MSCCKVIVGEYEKGTDMSAGLHHDHRTASQPTHRFLGLCALSLRHVGESAIRAINGTVLRESGRWRKECRIGRIAAARESLEDTKNINIDVEQ